MKKAACIIVLIITVACFSWYITEPDIIGRRVGHQSDDIRESQTITSKGEPTLCSDAETASAVSDALPLAQYVLTETEASAPALPELPGWKLVWQDEFDAPLLNMEYWTRIDRGNNFNEELQYYTPANTSIENGCLTLTAKKEELEGHSYTSAMVETQDKLDMLYGRIEARISLPISQGILSAFWLLSKNGHHELDILEMVGSEPGNIYGVCHYLKYRPWKVYGFTTLSDPREYHVYALEWDKDEVRWYVDDVQFFSTRTNVPDEPMYVVLTLAVGGVWPGAPDSTSHFPLSMRVDYVRIYSREMERDPLDIA